MQPMKNNRYFALNAAAGFDHLKIKLYEVRRERTKILNILIKNAMALLDDKEKFYIESCDIVIDGNKIERISGAKSENEGNFKKVIDASGRLVMPGLINAHTHAYMSLFRNYADDEAFWDWLSHVQAVEEGMTEEDCYWGTLLNAIEMLKTGTTCFVDMNIKSAKAKTGPESACAGAALESGMRAVITRGLAGDINDEESKAKFAEALHEKELFDDEERIITWFGPHAPYSCMENYLKEVKEKAKELGTGQTIHLSESAAEVENMMKERNCTPIQYAKKTGCFEVPTIAAHCVRLTDEDIRTLKENNVSVAINPKSNMKLGNGFARCEDMLNAGINICLGTDGCGSNNTQNMFAEMNTAALVYKGANQKAQCISAQDVLRFATVNGAKAIGLEGKTGVLKEGALADIIILDIYEPEFFPSINLVSGLVYSANGREVETVIIDGNIVMENRKILTIDEDKVYAECEKICARLNMF